MHRHVLTLVCFAVATIAHATEDRKNAPSTDWPRWRGPSADGVVADRKLPVRWDAKKKENIRWSVTLPGWGTSSPVVYGKRIFVTSQVDDKHPDRSDAAQNFGNSGANKNTANITKAAKQTNGKDPNQAAKKSLLVLCYDRDSGTELWRHDFGLGVDQHTHEKSNLAVNTPTVTPDAVYVAFGNADVARYTHDGKLVWVRRYMKDFGDPKTAWGYCVSPLVVEDAVVFPWDHHNGPCFLIGLDKRTGEFAWRKDRPIGTAHATPLFIEHHGRKEILVPGKNRLTCFDAKTHAELWQYGEGSGPYNGEIISSPVVGDGIVYLQLWRQSPIHAIRLTAEGKPEPLWVTKTPGPVEPSLLYYRGLLYVWMDNGVLVCLDGKTGAEHYRERLGGNCNASPIACDGHIYTSNNDGKTFVVRAGPKFELVATNELGERITASPAITGHELLYRTDSHLYLIGGKSSVDGKD